MKRILAFFVVALSMCSVMCGQSDNILKIVTPQMALKMYRTIVAYPYITQLMYNLLGASSAWDGELKIEAIIESPDDASEALIRLCDFLNKGGEEYMINNLVYALSRSPIS